VMEFTRTDEIEQAKALLAASAKPINKSWVEVLLDALESMSIENIRDYQAEVGTYIRCREKTKNPITAAYCDLIVTMTRYKIEENHEDVEKYRRWKKEYCRV
jgi:hypothetical protein